MMNKKKQIGNGIFLAAVFLITLYSIFHGQDMGELLAYISTAETGYWLAAVLCVILFIGSESVIIYYMMRTIRQKVRLLHCFLYSFVGFFFSCITPSATGGQPAQIYYMHKDDIPIPISTLVLMIVTITYKLVLVVLGTAVFLFRPAMIMEYLQPVAGWCYLGLGLNVFCVIFMLVLVFHPTLAEQILQNLLKAGSRLHLIHKEAYYREKIKHTMEQYRDVAAYFGTHKMVVGNVFLITIVQRFFLFFVTYLVYRSFGLEGTGMLTMVILQGMISVAVDMLPLPGGMGISEKLFLVLFLPVFGSVTLPGMMVSRGLGYYTELIVSALLTIVAHVVIGRTKGGNANDRIL